MLQCKGADGPNCLTAGQVEAVRRIYRRHGTSEPGKHLRPLEPGSELGWAT